ncbi:putative LPS assembly protein LptD [Lutimonas zeaxanthinifaciens]|uniref:putative LPS assembly protein LptD n=1 Tax=Lutimonas zeaxanthinifaciens TaxID=3060215 RepID=UPI00265D4F2D|nr:putative LPS assembly protein LptD [Lutimonas sp. YSD2104]WKK67001.1 putative LPS assembly protein LptD [Lutimonas sp. YSD2104]
MYTNLRYLLFFTLFFCFVCQSAHSQETQNAESKENNVNRSDSLKLSEAEIPSLTILDTTKTDTVQITPEYLEDNIIHKSKDYLSNDFINQRATLYDEAELYYQDIELKAGKIIIDYKNSLAIATGIFDTAGVYIQRPQFTQGQQASTQDSLIYNFENKKALIYNSRTEQQGMIITGDISKKENDSTFYINRARFTTSQKENPDYYVQTNNIKIVPDSKIVGGMSNLVISDVPTPLILPFFYSPLTSGRASGFIIPTWGQNNNQGYFLQNGGYYFAVNDYFDLALLGDIYTNGSWGLRAESNYNLRYKFTGNFSFRYENLINSQKGFPDYSKANNFFIRWSHSQSTTSNPTSRFSASVNFGSSSFFQESINESSSPYYLTNTFASSVSYYKKFVGTPFNLNASATHTQNTNTERIDMNLPSLVLNMDRIYPFAPKSGSKKNPIQNIGVTYAMNAQNRISTTDEEFGTAKMFDEAQTGVRHDISMSTNAKVLKFVSLAPTIVYKDVWYFKTIDKYWDDEINEVVTDTINGFDTYREYSAGISAGTTVYGMFNFKKGRLKAIRHVMRPSISYSYRPDFSQYYDEYQASIDPEDLREYSRFENGLYGAPSRNESSSIGMALNNTLEAKVDPKDGEEDEEPRKVKILNNLNFSTSYNIAADSLNWSPLRMTAGTAILKNKMALNVNATMDPYALNANGTRINEFNINNGGSLLRLTNANFTANYSISSKELKDKKSSGGSDSDPNSESASNMFGESLTARNQQVNADQEDVKKATLFKTVMPWDVRLRYSLTYNNTRAQNEITANSLQVSGNIEFSPKWRVGVSSGYDFRNAGITYTQLRFERDLDSWRFSFNWVPFGDRATYYFFIGIKSGPLSDLKYDQRKVPDRRLF